MISQLSVAKIYQKQMRKLSWVLLAQHVLAVAVAVAFNSMKFLVVEKIIALLFIVI